MRFTFSSSDQELEDLVDEPSLISKIKEAESRTSGEIKLYIERYNPLMSTIERAYEVFCDLKMENTERRNAVLMYVAYHDHEFALYGDTGIFEKYSQEEWNKLSHEMETYFREGHTQQALEYGITTLGHWLSDQFPHAGKNAKNELPDEIVFGL